jgi:hypothetical protein
MTGVFNDLLKRLNENEDYKHEEGGVAEPTEEPEVDETTGKKLKDFMMKRRLYGRFRKSKDTGNYSSKDMSEIFGKKKDEVRPSAPSPPLWSCPHPAPPSRRAIL